MISLESGQPGKAESLGMPCLPLPPLLLERDKARDVPGGSHQLKNGGKKNPKNTSAGTQMLCFPSELGIPGVCSFCRGIIQESGLAHSRCPPHLQDRPCLEQHPPNPSGAALEGLEGKGFAPVLGQTLWRCSPGISQPHIPCPKLVLGKALGKLVWIISQVEPDTLN